MVATFLIGSPNELTFAFIQFFEALRAECSMGLGLWSFREGSAAEGATKSLDINSEVSIVRYDQGIRIKFNREFRAGVLQIPIPVYAS